MQLVVLVGIPGAGKSTFYEKHLRTTHVHVSLDHWRGKKNRRRREEEAIRAGLQAGRDVAVDNTNPTVEDRARYVALASEFGAELVAYYFPVDRDGCLTRNRRRTGKGAVPEAAIFTILGKLQPPRHTEGFHTIYYVRVVRDGGFSVEPAREGG